MFAEIITIGDEILIGQIVDTNSAFISKALNKIGVSVYQITSVQDDKEHILKSLAEAEENADIIILTGGLGPTKDDITKKTIAEYFDDTLVQSESVLANIKHLWETFVKQPLVQVNIDQALVPSKCQVLMNKVGSAPGMWLEKNGKVFVSLPGVPFEMKALITGCVIPKLQEQFHFPYILHKTLLTYGLGESNLASRIEKWEDNLPAYIKLAYLPSLGRVRLRLTAKGTDKAKIEAEINKQVELLLPQIHDIFTGFEDEGSIEEVLADALVSENLTIATAESCTGGKVAERFTAIPGASRYFKGSVVSYATQSKIDVLKVSQDTIDKFSVVSEEVALEMAENARNLFKSDFAISTTGNAGPTKGDGDAEVGTVCLAIVSKEERKAFTFQFGNHRTKVINKAVNKAYELLLKEILKK
ncbi:MAG: damage-inducible protein CinA [Bacteroidetes bacterium MedPE-SWsnd-G2]|nr:MAG: damage-inducible protein CinA [Bacteroidetes bacterium MedPE-SWsnd-G2]